MAGSGLNDPLARLYGIAERLGVAVVVDSSDAAVWSDDGIAARVSFGEHIALSPRLDDHALHADLLAMALIVAAVMGDDDTGHPCAITAPGGLVVISWSRVPQPALGPGHLATLLARGCGRDTESAAFEYAVVPL